MILAGKLRHRVTIKKPTRSARDAFGGVGDGEVLVASRWARVSPLRGDERTSAEQSTQVTTHRIKLRYSSELAGANSSWWIEYDSRRFDFVSVINVDERNADLEILAREVPAS